MSVEQADAQRYDQQYDQRYGTFGVKAGISYYHFDLDLIGIDETSDAKMGFVAGFYAVAPINEFLAFQPELLFVQKGGESAGDLTDEAVTLNYIDLPILLRLNVPVAPEVRPYIIAGPNVGYLVSAETDNGNGEDIEDLFEDWNIGFSVGAGITLSVVTLDIRYEFGLTDITNGTFDDIDDIGDIFDPDDDSIRTNGFMVTLGLNF